MPADNKPFIYLAPQHQARLTRSGVIDTVANARRYETVETKSAIEKLGFSRNQCVAPALAIPLYNHLGQQVGVQIRPDKPRLNREAKPVKYESPPNSRPVIDIPPATRKAVLDPTGPLVITEGVIKADAAASKNIPCVSGGVPLLLPSVVFPGFLSRRSSEFPGKTASGNIPGTPPFPELVLFLSTQ